jgi:hypothetical protein
MYKLFDVLSNLGKLSLSTRQLPTTSFILDLYYRSINYQFNLNQKENFDQKDNIKLL